MTCKSCVLLIVAWWAQPPLSQTLGDFNSPVCGLLGGSALALICKTLCEKKVFRDKVFLAFDTACWSFSCLFMNLPGRRSDGPLLEMIKGGTLLQSGGIILLIWVHFCRERRENFKRHHSHTQYQDNLFSTHCSRFWDCRKEASWAAAKIKEWILINKPSVALYKAWWLPTIV